MSQRLAASVVALLVLAACATPAGSSTAAAPAAGAAASTAAKPAKPVARTKLVCESEETTGSHITTKRCRTVEQVDRERQATQVNLLKPGVAPPMP